MARAMRAEPAEVARLARRYLELSKELFEANRMLQADAPLSASDLGVGVFGELLRNVHTVVLGEAGTAVEQLIGVFEIDCENLYRVAFAYEKADEVAAAGMRTAGAPK